MGKRGPQKGRKRAKGGIPKHTCKREIERSVTRPGDGPWVKPKKTIYYCCETCGKSMGSSTVDL